MTKEKNDYKRIIELLKKSEPNFDQQAQTEEYILRQIEKKGLQGSKLRELAEVLFGWAYNLLARRILITASIVLVGIFVIQQLVLVKQVRSISRQVVVLKNKTESSVIPDLDSRLELYKVSGRFNVGGNIRISGRELEKLIEEYSTLDGKYQDLLKIINENPDLKSYVEKKLEEREKTKSEL